MSKKEFEALELKIIMFEESDIIRTSGDQESGGLVPDFGDGDEL